MHSFAPEFRESEVLIVEDNPGDARLLQSLLEESALEPLHFTHVDRLDEARDWLANNVTDAVLLDLGLPDANGMETLEALLPDSRNTPIVVISGSDDEGLRREAAALGAVDFVVKHDLDGERLARSLRSALEQSRLVAEIDRARRSARLAQAELAELVVQLDVPVVVVAPDHRILYANAACGRLFARDPAGLRGTALAVPVDRTRSRRVELTDTNGVHHDLDASAVPAHWRDHPAYLVMLKPHAREPDRAAHEDLRDTLRSLASEISAHALRLGGSLAAAEKRQDELVELARVLTASPRGAVSQRSRTHALRSIVTLAHEAREALVSAQDDLVRLRRLAMFAQRSLGSMPGPPLATSEQRSSSCSIGQLVDEGCRAVHARFGADVHMVATNTAERCPADPSAARRIVQRLLAGLVSACRELDAGALKLRIRTSEATNSVLVSVDAYPDRCIEAYRARVLRLLVGQLEGPEAHHDLASARAGIREAGGNLRFGSGDDGSLWLNMSLPDRGPN